MIFTAVKQDITRNELIVFGKIDESDRTIQDIDYIIFDWTKIFVQETINRFIELEKRKAEIHGESLA